MNNQYTLIFPETSVQFINIKSGEVKKDIWHVLKEGNWKNADTINYESNNLKGVLKRDQWKAVIPNIVPLYPGMRWNHLMMQIEEPRFIPQIKKVNLLDVITAANRFFKKYDGKRIGVQLSGGLDSSIIIGLLNYLKIPFWLVGMTSQRYEFRTERYIQHKLIPFAQDTILIDYEKHLPLNELQNVPPHQHPELLSINYSSENAMAEACQKLGVEVLFTGDGGDNLFAEALPINPLDCPWLPQVFSDSFPADLIYAPKGVQLVPFFADEGFMNCIYNLRRGKEEDNSKWWARKYFELILPQELVNYNYCADFWGLYISGLQNAIPTIQKLFIQAYDLTKDKAFADIEFERLINQDLLDAKKEMYQVIEARIAFAVWLNSLKKVDGVI
jgi:hypothetical protein